MNLKDSGKNVEMELNERYNNYTDVQILEILKKHKDYQEMAVNVAVKIAIDRQLINSDQDLLAPEFQESKSYRFTLFPEVTSEFHKKRLIESIFRFLYLISLLPMIYGILNYAKGEFIRAAIGVGIGLVWLFLCILLNKTKKLAVFIPLFILLSAATILTVRSIFTSHNFQFLDLIILVVGILLLLYMLMYLKKISRDS